MTETIDEQTSASEEVFNGVGTGVEIESGDTADYQEIKPWDPDKIRVSTKNFSLRNALDLIDSNELDLAPDFQRNRVWKERQKSRLIESLLLQIPLPAFYFAEDDDGLLRVVDGLQRLSTIHSYVRERDFGLRDLEYLEREHGKVFDDLSPALQRRLNNAQIVVHVIDPSTPSDVKYDIFKRINTGGEPLNAMEIRHCMSRSRSREFLKRCTASEEFQFATGGVLRDHVRMNDREAALRFLAFYSLPDLDAYDDYGSLERLLDETTRRIDDPSYYSDDHLETLFEKFENAMRNAYYIFGKHAFRKWPVGQDRLSPINRALLETWGVILAEAATDQLAPDRDYIVSEARQLMTNDELYIGAISASTADPARVRIRFDRPRQILGAVGLA